MIDYESQFQSTAYAPRETLTVSRVFTFVYGWMAAGLALSGLTAWYAFSGGLLGKMLENPGSMMACIIGELALVFVLSAAINKLPVFAAFLMYIGYAVLNGITLSVIFIAYDMGLIQNVFFITAGMFAGLALWGTVTKSDLSGVGAFCGMALWGIIIALIVNIFVGSGPLDLVISFVGVLVFTGLTMYDAQKIRQLVDARSGMDMTSFYKAGLMGALALYLDFVNLFLYLLKLFGRKR